MQPSSTRRRGPRRSTDGTHTHDKSGVDAIPPTPDTNLGLVIFRRIFNYLLITGIAAGLLYVYYTYFLFDAPTSAAVVDVEEFGQPFAVIDIPGKGKGAIATRNIARGELILREQPLFVVPHLVHASPGGLLLSRLAALSSRQRAKFYNLSYVRMPTSLHRDTPEYNEALALAIFQTNSIAAGADNTGIFPRTARLNHGCSKAFNSVYTWRENEGAIVVHALKDVKEGEELLTTYTDTKRPRHERREYLKSVYDFECTCSVCSLPDELSQASDARLSSMVRVKSQFATWGSGEISGRQAIERARELWALGEAEGYWSERGQLAADAALVAAAHSDEEATRVWAARAREWYGYEIGRDSEQVGEMDRVEREPATHGWWGLRAHEDVGGV